MGSARAHAAPSRDQPGRWRHGRDPRPRTRCDRSSESALRARTGSKSRELVGCCWTYESPYRHLGPGVPARPGWPPEPSPSRARQLPQLGRLLAGGGRTVEKCIGGGSRSGSSNDAMPCLWPPEMPRTSRGSLQKRQDRLPRPKCLGRIHHDRIHVNSQSFMTLLFDAERPVAMTQREVLLSTSAAGRSAAPRDPGSRPYSVAALSTDQRLDLARPAEARSLGQAASGLAEPVRLTTMHPSRSAQPSRPARPRCHARTHQRH